MSNSVHTCPHCGESDFIQRNNEIKSKKCSRCNGTGLKPEGYQFGNKECMECNGSGKENFINRTITTDKRKRV